MPRIEAQNAQRIEKSLGASTKDRLIVLECREFLKLLEASMLCFNVLHHTDVKLSLQGVLLNLSCHLFSKLPNISMTTMLAPSSSQTLLLFLQISTKTKKPVQLQ